MEGRCQGGSSEEEEERPSHYGPAALSCGRSRKGKKYRRELERSEGRVDVERATTNAGLGIKPTSSPHGSSLASFGRDFGGTVYGGRGHTEEDGSGGGRQRRRRWLRSSRPQEGFLPFLPPPISPQRLRTFRRTSTNLNALTLQRADPPWGEGG